ncbi:TetR/AcrR family transcriptional regulator [Actibacterium lipolyticum]|uniref:Putative HTH-type transcriptional regulator YxaF n=1 Tax=Actibacterium lipolyticum TaxID=1524263 RepID=A0A238KSR4_9RHOB|nr:TetR/AcrR family transcriptional regulator [Actibacterium lipolyticum]SMX45142.1 putative HTH-type transcriptional regulator YxaF [Actibacterium lipolyticum]
MSTKPASTRDRLTLNAVKLFRQKGYHGVGLAEILAESDAPKGSLYHHFPNGKADLAVAAATLASDMLLQTIDDSFANAPTFREGGTNLCFKLAKFFDISGTWDGCPVSGILFDGPENEVFRDHANSIFTGWLNRVAEHARRLNEPRPDEKAEMLLITIQGAWTLARARRDSDVLRALPSKFLGPCESEA